MKLTTRKDTIRAHIDKFAKSRSKWIDKNSYYYQDDHNYMSFLASEGQRVLELGCGTGHLLDALNPSYGVGVDLSEESLGFAKKLVQAENLELKLGDNLDIPLGSNFSDSDSEKTSSSTL